MGPFLEPRLHHQGDIDFDKVQKDVNIIWRKHKRTEINTMGRNLFVFKFKTADDVNHPELLAYC